MINRALVKGVLTNILSIMQGTVITGVTVVSSGEPNSSTIKLWHMHLELMSERSMRILTKQNLLEGRKVWKLDLCERCVFNKQKMIQFWSCYPHDKAHFRLQSFNSLGLFSSSLKRWYRYILTFIYDYFRMFWMYLLKKE